MRFKAAARYPMEYELYDLNADPLEKNNLFGLTDYDAVSESLRQRISEFFATYTNPEYDLWNGGSAKSNVTYDKLWQDAWGADWKPEFSG